MENYYLGNGRQWVVSELPAVEQISHHKEQNLPELIEKLLIQRNIKGREEASAFLNPSLDALHDPFLLEGMNSAVDRIVQALQNQEKILVYGDYDVDGVSATAILVRFFQSLKARIEYYIPDRVDEGYGISDLAVAYISDQDFDLVITVDCGISARFQVDALYERYRDRGKNIDVIITDHHQWNEQLLPEALVVINPHIPTSQYPYKNLCGAGVALKLVQAVSSRFDNPRAYEDYLDLAALATIADIVELKGENRIITKYGIEKIVKNPCQGIKALLKVSAAQPNQLDSGRISFTLAPRVNAAGRMGDAKWAVSLFTTDDEQEAEKIAQLLNQSNTRRQEVQNEIYLSAVQKIEEDPRYHKEKVLVVYGEGWHHGVIGIVASKLVDRYHKPVFVLSIEDEKAVGSGRSIEGFNLFNALESLSDVLIKFGGHEQAGGLTLMTSNLELFRTRLNTYADNAILEEMLLPTMAVDLHIEGREINLKTAKLISRLEPFGSGNQTPLFCFRGAVLLDKKVIGNGKHLRLNLSIEGQTADGVYFGKGHLEKGLFVGDRVDIVFTQDINVWNNTESLQIKVLDMRLSDSALKRNRFLLKAAHQVECLDCDENWLYNGINDKIIKLDDIVINRDILAIIYRYINQMDSKALSLSDLFVHTRILENETKKNINCFKLFVALLIFDELELMGLQLESDGIYRLTPSDLPKKVNLEDSEILDWVNQTVQQASTHI